MKKGATLRRNRGHARSIGAIIPDPPGPGMVTQIAHVSTLGTVEFFFSRPYKAKHVAGGIPLVESDTAGNIVDITPQGETVTSAAWVGTGSAKTSFKVGGAEDRPYKTDLLAPQAFSEFVAYAATSGGQGSALAPFDNGALQGDPTLRGSPFPLAAGSTGDFWKAVHNPALTAPSVVWKHFSNFGILLRAPDIDVVPDDLIWMVPTDATETAFLYPAVSEMNKAALGSPRTWPPAGVTKPALATCKAGGYFPEINPFFLGNSEARRRFMLTRTTTSGYSGGNSGWGLDFNDHIAAILAAGTGALDADLIPIVRTGLHLFANHVRGNPLVYNGAGQHQGHAQILFLTAALFYETYPQFLDYAFAITSNVMSQPFWVTSAEVGALTNRPGTHSYLFDVFETSMLNTVGWRKATPPTPPTEIGAWGEIDYQEVAGEPSLGEFTNIVQIFVPGLNKYMYELIANDMDHWDPSVPLAAAGANWDRWSVMASPAGNLLQASNGSLNTTRDGQDYARVRPTIPIDVYEGVPEAITIYPTRNVPLVLNSVAGGFFWNWTNIGHRRAEVPITSYETRFGHTSALPDGKELVVQYFNADAYNDATNTQTGLVPGLRYGVSYRRGNAYGLSSWSKNIGKFLIGGSGDPGPRMIVTPTGVAAGAVVNVELPLIHHYVYPLNTTPIFAAAGATISKGTYSKLVAGLGLWEGAGLVGDTPDIQWYKNGVAAGGTAGLLDISGDAVGTVYKFTVTWGGVVVESPTVTSVA